MNAGENRGFSKMVNRRTAQKLLVVAMPPLLALTMLSGCTQYPDSKACETGLEANQKMANALAEFFKEENGTLSDDVLAKFIVLSASLNSVKSDTPEIQEAFSASSDVMMDILFKYSEWKLENKPSAKAVLKENLENLMPRLNASSAQIDTLCSNK